MPREKHLMTPEEIQQISKIASSLGMNKIKLTGGEPLLRSDIVNIVRKISPLVTFAETVSVRTQNREEFLGLLSRALAFDAREEAPEFRLANLLSQRKAKWLVGRVDELFL